MGVFDQSRPRDWRLGLIVVAAALFSSLALLQMTQFERASQGVARIEALSSDIMRLDALLTLSATVGAATGERQWRSRYDSYVPELDAALAAALRLGGDNARAHIQSVSQSNQSLIEMETRAFAHAAAGDTQSAMAVMVSADYAAAKARYSEGVRLALSQSRARAAEIRDRVWAGLFAALAAAFAAVALYAWRINQLRALRRQARLQESLDQTEAARNLLERTVAERTADLTDAVARAQASERAKTQFLANMSHEIRTPLNGVVGLSAALADTPLAARQQEMVDLIRTSGETLDRLVSEILDLSKIEAGKLELHTESFDLRKAVESAAELMRGRAEAKGVAFSVRADAAARGLYEGDPVRIRQIAANLISNAVKFTEAGAVEVTLAADEEPDGLTRVTLAVADTGIGFDEETARRLFSPFEQADTSITARFGGTGLGLSICKSLASMMGGAISAKSTPGRGSCFTVALRLRRSIPLAAYDSFSVLGPEGGESALTPSTTVRGLSVLLAEDHPVNQRVVQLLLEPHGVSVMVAADGEEALFAFRNCAFDAILMDMMMPKIDGLAAARAIRAFERARNIAPTPIIMLTANAMQAHIDEALEAGCDSHLAKPVNARSLLLALGRVRGDQAKGDARSVA